MSRSSSECNLRNKVATAERVDRICDQFEALLLSSDPAEIESWLDGLTEPDYTSVLRELVALEVNFRLANGETPAPHEYIIRFPGHAQVILDTFQLVTRVAGNEDRRRTEGSPTALSLGEAIGRFELRQVLGHGAFGTVYRAYDSQLDREIALKVPNFTGDEDRREVARLQKEARSAAQLRHPNIVAVHDVGDVDGVYFIASELIDGKTLQKLLNDGRRFSAYETAVVIRKLAHALQCAHAKGIIHRDIKPGNVILDQADEPHLTDFGLACRESGDEVEFHEGTVSGTPAYMSPEQASGQSRLVGAASDIWALGVVMFELLTGQRPFLGSGESLMQGVLHEQPRRPREIDATIPRKLETICLRCLAKETSDRYGSCQEMLRELDEWLKSNSTDSRTASTIAAVKHRQTGTVAVAALALAVVLIVIVSFVLPQGHQPINAVQRSDRIRPAGASPKNNHRETRIRPYEYRDVGPSSLRTVAFSPDGLLLATAGSDRAIVIWDAEGNAKWRIPAAHQDDIWSVSFDPRGSVLASASEDGTVKLWHVGRRENVGVRQHAGPVWCVVFRPAEDGATTFASTSSDGIVRIWSLDSPTPLETIDFSSAVWAAAFSQDGSVLACGDVEGGITLWDVVLSRKILTTRGHQQGVSSIAFSSTSTRFASAGEQGDVKVWRWDRERREIRCDHQLPSHDEGANHVAFNRDGSILTSVGDDHKLRLWDTQAEKEILQIEAHRNPIFSVVFNPSATMLATAGGDGSVRLWGISNNNVLRQQTVLTHASGPQLRSEFVHAILLSVKSSNSAHVPDATTKPGRADIYRFDATDSGYIEVIVRPKSELIAKLYLHDDDLRRQSDGTPYGVDSHQSNNKRRICRVTHEVRAGGVYYLRIAAKDLRKPLQYELAIGEMAIRETE